MGKQSGRNKRIKQMPEKYGSVYTPSDLADFVAEVLLSMAELQVQGQSIKVLDPASGELSLLKAIARNISVSMKASFFGVDRDAEAISASAADAFCKNYSVDLCLDDFICPSNSAQTSANEWLQRLGKFDLVISNPPWSSDRCYPPDFLKECGFCLAEGQYDSYVLFIELSLKLLAEGGCAAFILPDSVFSASSYELRRYIVENYEIGLVARLGEKLFPEVHRATTVMVIKNCKPAEASQVRCFRLDPAARASVFRGESSLLDEYEKASHYVNQSRFSADEKCMFDIDATTEEEKLLSKLESVPCSLTSQFSFGRGVEISKSGQLAHCPHCGVYQGVSRKQIEQREKVCKHCGSSFSFQSVLVAVKSDQCEGSVPVLVGEDIGRYEVRACHYIMLGLEGVSYKKQSLYSPPKILVRKTGLGINAVVDTEGLMVTQTIYVMKPVGKRDNQEWLWYYLALLNSRVIYYYYTKRYGENEWKSHPYLTKEILFSLPLFDFEAASQQLVSEIAWMAERLQQKYERQMDIDLEKKIFELYGLDEDEKSRVRSSLAKLPNLSSINGMKF